MLTGVGMSVAELTAFFTPRNIELAEDQVVPPAQYSRPLRVGSHM